MLLIIYTFYYNVLYVYCMSYLYLFYILSYNLKLLFSSITPAVTTGSPFRLLCPFDIPHQCVLCISVDFLFVTPCFLVLKYAPGSSCLLPSPAVELSYVWFLLLENGIRNQDLGIGAYQSLFKFLNFYMNYWYSKSTQLSH